MAKTPSGSEYISVQQVKQQLEMVHVLQYLMPLQWDHFQGYNNSQP